MFAWVEQWNGRLCLQETAVYERKVYGMEDISTTETSVQPAHFHALLFLTGTDTCCFGSTILLVNIMLQ